MSLELTETPSPKTTTGFRHITVEKDKESTKGHDVEHRENANTTELLSDAEAAWCRVRRYLQDPFSEFCGVFILMLFGDGGVAQVVLSGGTKGDYQSISWSWG